MTITDREVIEEFRDQQKLAQTGGKMIGGGPGLSDQDADGGSSGTGGYGNAQDQQFQGQNAGLDTQSAIGTGPDGLSRGERFDVEQGGGRGPDELETTNELEVDQQAHQDRGQSVAEEQEESGERS